MTFNACCFDCKSKMFEFEVPINKTFYFETCDKLCEYATEIEIIKNFEHFGTHFVTNFDSFFKSMHKYDRVKLSNIV